MKRKMIIGAVALLAFAGTASAQGFAEAKWGVKAGWNNTNITNGREGSVDESKSLNSFNAGVIGAIPLGSTFEIRTGLDFQSKGTESTELEVENEATDTKTKRTFKVNPLYVELPVNIAVMLPFNEKMKAYVGAGPYAAVGIAGKFKTTTKTTVGNETSTETSNSESINWGNDNPADPNENSTTLQGTVGSGDFKRFDFGANIIAGLDFGKFGVHAQYGIGLTNTNPGRSNEDNANKSNQHRAIGVSGVFYF